MIKPKTSKMFHVPLLGGKETIPPDGKISFPLLNLNTFRYYRSIYLSKDIISPADGMMGKNLYLGVSVNHKTFGFLCISEGYGSVVRGGDELFVLADFAIPSLVHRRLSKLVCMSLCTFEVFDFCMGFFNRKFSYLKTHVFTDKPVSMKYRGVMKLERRKPGALMYVGNPKWKMEELIQIWYKKHEKKR